MAIETAEQRKERAVLEDALGETSYRMIEDTPAAYGLVQLVWAEVQHARVAQRVVLIRPDGSRVCFREL